MDITRRNILRLAAGAAGLASPTRVLGQGPTTLRVAYIPFEASAQLFYAQELGLWAKAGLALEMQPTPFGAAIAAAVAGGAADIGYATVMTLAAAHAKQIPFAIIAPANAYSTAQPVAGELASQKNLIVRSGKDLDGKTIGTPGLNTLGEYGVRAWVDAHGGDATTLHFVEIPFPEMPAALEGGRIDAAFVAPPFYGIAVAGGAHPVAPEFDAIAKEFLVAGWFATVPWSKAHTDVVTRFRSVVHDAVVWANAHPGDCVDILVKYLKVDRAAIAGTPRTYFPLQLTPALVQPGIEVTARYAHFPSFPASELIAASS